MSWSMKFALLLLVVQEMREESLCGASSAMTFYDASGKDDTFMSAFD